MQRSCSSVHRRIMELSGEASMAPPASGRKRKCPPPGLGDLHEDMLESVLARPGAPGWSGRRGELGRPPGLARRAGPPLPQSKYEYKGETKYMAVTQFEPVYARRCFPSWDEPAFKAKFKLILEVPSELVALSNMPVANETVAGPIKTVHYEESPLMSTYLVAIVVGLFEYIEGVTSQGTKVRVYTQVGKSNQGKFALDVVVKSLDLYKDFLTSLTLDEPNAEEDGKKVQTFFAAMETSIKEHPLWANAANQEIDHALKGLEKYIMTILFDRTFASSAEDAIADMEISGKIALLQQFVSPHHLDIPKVLPNEASWLLAVKELQKINSFKSPREKLLCGFIL